MVDNINISRPSFNQETFHKLFNKTNSRSPTQQLRSWSRKQFTCSTER